MKVLGLDIGFAKVGVAVGDTATNIAFPRKYIPFEIYLKELDSIIQQENIEHIVVGEPLLSSGEKGVHHHRIMQEKSNIESIYKLPITIFDERFSTQIAQKGLRNIGISAKKQKHIADSAAAAVILQNWMDARGMERRKEF